MSQPLSRNDKPLLSAQLLGPLLITLDGRVVDTGSSRRTRHVLTIGEVDLSATSPPGWNRSDETPACRIPRGHDGMRQEPPAPVS